MTLFLLLFAVAIGLLGHISIFVFFVNRLHAMAWPRPLIKAVDFAWSAFGALVPIGAAILVLRVCVTEQPILAITGWNEAILIYFAVCIFAAVTACFQRIQFLIQQRPVAQLVSNHTDLVDIVEQLQHRPIRNKTTQLLSRLPGNEILELAVHKKTLAVANLPDALEGMTISHLSDLHMTGQLDVAFYEEVVRQTNALGSDIVVVTGDIVEKRCCLEWIAGTLGQLESHDGVYYVVGNHELRIRDIALVRQTLREAGLIGLGSKWSQIAVNDHPVVLAGNELPWFGPAPDMSDCPTHSSGERALRILLSHSPDQFAWATAHNFDLMLAGHTHGGQVRFPLIGPVLAPSRFGVRHASGTFYVEPTLLHVSRGIAGTRPLRLNCRPELAQLILTSG